MNGWNALSSTLRELTGVLKKKKSKEKTPPGMEPVVHALKNNPKVDNPWAVAWSMYNRQSDPKHWGKFRESARLMEEISPAQDAVVEGHVLKVVLITEGLGNQHDMNYYGPEAIASAPAAFEGKPCFINHPTASEDREIPERKVECQCGYFKNLSVQTIDGQKACVGELHLDLSETGSMAYGKALTALHYNKEFPDSENEYVGLSVNADGRAEKRTMTIGEEKQDVNYVMEFTEGASCDMVTRPARGGRILALVEDINGALVVSKEARMKVKKMLQLALATLKEAAGLKDAALKDKKLVEAQKTLVEADAEMASEGEAMDYMARRENESEDEHKGRLMQMAAALKKHLSAYGGEEESEGEEEESEGEEDDADGDGDDDSHDKVPPKDMESSRLAVKHLIAEAKIPAKVFDAADIEALAKMKLVEAKREISRVARLSEAIQRDTIEKLELPPSYAPKGVRESHGVNGNELFKTCLKG